MATVSDFVVLEGGEFLLPSLYTTNLGKTHSSPDQSLKFQLPTGVKSKGILSWVIATQKGSDDGIDIEYVIQGKGYTWVHRNAVFFGIQVPIGGLQAGFNSVTFHVNKAGTVTAPDPDEYYGGKGRLQIGQVCLQYQRTQ